MLQNTNRSSGGSKMEDFELQSVHTLLVKDQYNSDNAMYHMALQMYFVYANDTLVYGLKCSFSRLISENKMVIYSIATNLDKKSGRIGKLSSEKFD